MSAGVLYGTSERVISGLLSLPNRRELLLAKRRETLWWFRVKEDILILKYTREDIWKNLTQKVEEFDQIWSVCRKHE